MVTGGPQPAPAVVVVHVRVDETRAWFLGSLEHHSERRQQAAKFRGEQLSGQSGQWRLSLPGMETGHGTDP